MRPHQWEIVAVSVGSVLMRYAENLNLLEKLELMKPISKAVQNFLDGTDLELRAVILEILKKQPKLSLRQRRLITAQVAEQISGMLAAIIEEPTPQGYSVN